MVFSLILPTSVPVYFWNEDPIVALFCCFFCRTVLQLNGTWLVNSAAHLYGTRPFDKYASHIIQTIKKFYYFIVNKTILFNRTIFPVESMFVALFAVGEGWHNYHHAFPWDYRASELGSPLNMTGFLIDLLAKIGAVYDRKQATHNMIKNRVFRTGDSSHRVYGTEEGRSAFKTLFNIWKHPLNPTYNSLFAPKPKIINGKGYALDSTELAKNELDEDLLSAENKKLELQQQQLQNGRTSNIEKYIVEKPVATTTSDGSGGGGALGAVSASTTVATTTYKECNNNNNMNRIRVAKDKSDLNINVDEVLLVKI